MILLCGEYRFHIIFLTLIETRNMPARYHVQQSWSERTNEQLLLLERKKKKEMKKSNSIYLFAEETDQTN